LGCSGLPVQRGLQPLRPEVSESEGPFEAEVEQANSRLNEGLKSCRTVLESYRVVLTRQSDSDPVEPLMALNDNTD
jgi:hypothetical protein